MLNIRGNVPQSRTLFGKIDISNSLLRKPLHTFRLHELRERQKIRSKSAVTQSLARFTSSLSYVSSSTRRDQVHNEVCILPLTPRFCCIVSKFDAAFTCSGKKRLILTATLIRLHSDGSNRPNSTPSSCSRATPCRLPNVGRGSRRAKGSRL